MRKLVDAIGDTCPIPVVKTKNAIKELGNRGGIVETWVDNEIAVQNLTKMAKQMGYSVKNEKIEEYKFKVELTVNPKETEAEKEVSGDPILASGPDIKDDKDTSSCEITCNLEGIKKNLVVAISSGTMGTGDDTLGTVLMKSFIYALSQQEELPETMLFYNGGAKLTCQDAPTLEDLKEMQARGVEILTCGTCLNHFGLTEKLKVGSVTNMYVISEKMTQASLIIKP